jgi:signal transduction histidine kinase
MTSYDRDDRQILAAYELGAVDFLFKPVAPAVLRAKASFFVDLRRRTAEVARQAELLRDHERREHLRALAEERSRWEAGALRRQMEVQRRSAEELSRKATELATTVEERERAEQELTVMNFRLAEADRRKDEFIALLAHELRNPLAPLVLGLERLRLSAETDPGIGRVQAVMERQARHLTRLVDDLLDVTRIQSGAIELRRELCRLDDVVSQAVEMSRPDLDRGKHRLTLSLPEDPIQLDADLVRLTQVVSNLLGNAARYTEPGGQVELKAERIDSEVKLSVADSGRGISAEHLPKIFDMFVR